jgi:hypothetical protein
VRRLAIVILVLSGCVADDDDSPPSVVTILTDDGPTDDPNREAICTAASELPETELCSAICDADAFKARLADSGFDSGACYQIRCELAELTVNVGVCL